MAKDTIISGCRLVIIGGSAGSLEVLMKILPGLPALKGFAIVIVLHRKTAEDSTLEELIAAKTTVPVREVEDKIALLPGYIYVAPSDYHLLFEKEGLLSLDTSEKINYSRPSIDVSFESAADVYKNALAGILLSGANADGTEGMKAVRKEGGVVIVQDPATAEISFMPQNAILYTYPDYILNVQELGALIASVNAGK